MQSNHNVMPASVPSTSSILPFLSAMDLSPTTNLTLPHRAPFNPNTLIPIATVFSYLFHQLMVPIQSLSLQHHFNTFVPSIPDSHASVREVPPIESLPTVQSVCVGSDSVEVGPGVKRPSGRRMWKREARQGGHTLSFPEIVRGAPKITQLFFVDDTLLFGRATTTELDCVKQDDPWLLNGGGGLVSLDRVDNDVVSMVSELIDHANRTWDIPRLWELFSEDLIQRVLVIPVGDPLFSDELIWHFSKNGIYSSRSGYVDGTSSVESAELGGHPIC
ncbi:hypothetical protein ACS0TY_013201 [Phlomoides rotata]